MRTRKILLGVVAAAAIATPLAMAAAPANAYTTNADGSLHVTKGEVQSAFKWNNKEFDQNVGSLKFNVDGTSVQSNHFEGIAGGTIYSGDLVTTITRTTTQAQTLSDNGKQINGWDLNLSAATSSTDYAHGTANRAMNNYTMAKIFGAADGGSAWSLVVSDEATGAVTVTFGNETKTLAVTPAPIA